MLATLFGMDVDTKIVATFVSSRGTSLFYLLVLRLAFMKMPMWPTLEPNIGLDNGGRVPFYMTSLVPSRILAILPFASSKTFRPTLRQRKKVLRTAEFMTPKPNAVL